MWRTLIQCYLKDLKEIGVRPSGYLHHLEKAINKLPHTPIQAGLPVIMLF